MSDLPPGFVIDTQAPASSDGLPAGFAIDGQAPAQQPQRQKTFVEKLGETWPGRAVQSIYSAVTLPGDVMAGKAHVPGSPDAQAIPGSAPAGDKATEDRIADLTLLANPMSAASRAGVGIFGAPTTTAGKNAAPTVAELKTAARAGYESPAVKELEVRPQAVANFATGLKSRINEIGLDDTLAPKTFAILSKVEQVPQNALMTGQNLRTLQKTLGKASMATDPQEKLAATKALVELNKHLENFPAADVLKGSADDFSSVVSRANKNYSAAKTAEALDRKLVSAQLRADSTNSGMNVANTIRQNMRQVVTKPKEARGLTPAELETATGIVQGTPGQNAVRAAGSLLGGGGGLGSMAAAAVGGYATGGPGAALPLAGYALKALANKMTVRQAQKLEEAIRSRAPLASSMTKYEEKAAAFERAKNTRTFSDLAIASRNLKNNLAAVGIDAQVRDLMNYSSQSE